MRERVGIVPIVEKMIEARLRWFGHVWRKSVEASLRRVDQMKGSPVARDRGRPRKTIDETIKRDLNINVLT